MGARKRLAWHPERTEGIENINICSDKIKGRDQFENLSADAKMILRKRWI
jgi:hypothetical protein